MTRANIIKVFGMIGAVATSIHLALNGQLVEAAGVLSSALTSGSLLIRS
jgi:hypothetical protein